MARGKRRGLLGFSVADAVAVREVVGRQTALRREVCRLLAMGYSQRETAEWLEMSPPRLHFHVRALRRAFVNAGFEDWLVGQRRRKRRSRWQLTRLGGGRKKCRKARRCKPLAAHGLR
jgi:hypothetical protein